MTVLADTVDHTGSSALLVVAALLGIADTVFGLRRRFKSGKAGPGQPPTLST